MNSTKKKKYFDKLYKEYYVFIFNAIYKRTGSLENSEDICQEVFIAFYHNLEKIREMRKWLMGTAKNQISLFYRSKKKQSENKADLEEIEDDIKYSFENGTRDLRIVLKNEIENSNNYESEIDRSVFDLIAVYKYSYKETANQLGLTPRKVRYKYAKITEKIVNNLKKSGIQGIENLL